MLARSWNHKTSCTLVLLALASLSTTAEARGRRKPKRTRSTEKVSAAGPSVPSTVPDGNSSTSTSPTQEAGPDPVLAAESPAPAWTAPDPDLADMPPPPAPVAPSSGPGENLATASAGLRASGRWRSDLQVDVQHDREDEDVYELHSRLDLELASPLSAALSLVAGGRLRYDVRGTQERYSAEVEARDLYLHYRRGRVSARVGQQVIRWGSTDSYSPNDVVNPVDYREGLPPSFETPLLPVPALQVQASAGPLGLEGVYVPFFVPHRFALMGTDWGFVGSQASMQPIFAAMRNLVSEAAVEDLQQVLTATDPPEESPLNGSAGGRVIYHRPSLDLHASALLGWDRVPDLRFDLATGRFSSRYFRQLVLGMDGSLSIGKFVVKADAAVSSKQTLYTESLVAVRVPAASWATGFDYAASSRSLITIELGGFHALKPPPPGDTYYLLDETTFQVAAYYRHAWRDDRIFVEISGRYGLTRRDLFLSSSVSYRLAPNHRVAVGTWWLEGPSNSLGGIFDANDLAYGNYTLSF
ncbi:MAG: hypothetical protein HY698_10155 [Deltaproteobacteria bacterium]|nr:hypothetical protein [Deltaproteobacteria bacterium]